MLKNRRICIDWDGVCVDENNNVIPGAVEAIKKLKEWNIEVILVTARRATPGFLLEVKEKGFEFDDINICGVYSPKINADFYVDDRAIEFKGDWNESLDRILSKCPRPD